MPLMEVRPGQYRNEAIGLDDVFNICLFGKRAYIPKEQHHVNCEEVQGITTLQLDPAIKWL